MVWAPADETAGAPEVAAIDEETGDEVVAAGFVGPGAAACGCAAAVVSLFSRNKNLSHELLEANRGRFLLLIMIAKIYYITYQSENGVLVAYQSQNNSPTNEIHIRSMNM